MAGPTAAAALPPLTGADNEGTNEGAKGDSADDEGRRCSKADDDADGIAAATTDDTDAGGSAGILSSGRLSKKALTFFVSSS